jgi:hypothetical protein
MIIGKQKATQERNGGGGSSRSAKSDDAERLLIMAGQLSKTGKLDVATLLSKTDRNLATRVANGGFGCPELEI